jgi:hypothetical protein
MAAYLPISYPQAINALAPGAQYSMTDMFDYSTLQWYSTDIQQPTKEACDAEIPILEAQQPLNACKQQASKLLYETDWTTIPDVADPTKSNPYLVNVQDYVTYRSALRQLAVYPVANPVWPTKPVSQWGTP